MKKQKILDEIKNRVTAINPEIKIWLYGSQARANKKLNSDWDILLLTPKKLHYKERWELTDTIYDLGIEFGEVFSVFVYSKDEWENIRMTAFHKNVEKDKIPV